MTEPTLLKTRRALLAVEFLKAILRGEDASVACELSSWHLKLVDVAYALADAVMARDDEGAESDRAPTREPADPPRVRLEIHYGSRWQRVECDVPPETMDWTACLNEMFVTMVNHFLDETKAGGRMIEWAKKRYADYVFRRHVAAAVRQFNALMPQQRLLAFISFLHDYPDIAQQFRRALGMQDRAGVSPKTAGQTRVTMARDVIAAAQSPARKGFRR